MSSAAGPRIATDGLVLAYDSANTQKSWLGQPTTNLLANPTNEVIGTTSEFVQYADLASIFDTYGTGVTYSLSLELKSKVPGNILAYMQNGSVTKYSFVNSSITATTEYQRFTFNGLTAAISTPTETRAVLAFYGVYGSGRIPSIRNVQVEINNFATPFVNGTRANTQAVIDLTGNNTITATSLTYASSGTFSFNGTSDSVVAPFNASTFTFNNEQTIIMWMTNQAPSALRRNPYNQAYAGAGTITHEPSYAFNYYYGTQGGNGSPYTALGSSFTVLVGETAFVAVTRNISTTSWYKNGTFSNSGGNPYGSTVLTGTQPITIGNGYAGYFGGSIYNVQVYNRALTANEIAQNFNAQRGRYGL